MLERSRLWDEERLREYQWARIHAIITHAYHNTAFYRRRYEEVGAHPKDIRTWEDFARLPFVTRTEAINFREEFIPRNFGDFNPIETHTSGSTGQPLKLWRSRDTELMRRAIVWRWRHALGVTYRDTTADLSGYQMKYDPGAVAGFNPCENEWHINPEARNRENTAAVFDTLRRAHPQLVHGAPTVFTIYGHYARELGLDPLEIPVIITVGECHNSLHRRVIEAMYSRRVFDYYGNRENTMIATQCEVNGPYLIAGEFCYLEALDERARPIQAGQSGEVVSTTLTNYAFPLIRYRTGDIATPGLFVRSEHINAHSLDAIGGRRRNLLLTRDGARAIDPHDITERTGFTRVKFFRIIQRSLLEIDVEVVPEAAYERVRDEAIFRDLFTKIFAEEVSLTFHYLDNIPAGPNGKAPIVESLPAERYLNDSWKPGDTGRTRTPIQR